MRLALQLYTLREFAQTPDDLGVTLAKVRTIGYEVVEIAGICQIEAGELAKMLRDSGLTACSVHLSHAHLTNENGKAIDQLHTLDCKYAVISGMPERYRNAEGYAKFAREATELGKKLADAGLSLGYHNHSFELESFGGRTGLRTLFEDSDRAYLKAQLDVYWIQHGGGDPAWWARECLGRLPMVHLKDMTVRNNVPIMAEIGEGNLNWPHVLDACQSAGVEWYIVEQDECERDPFESIAISLRNLKKMGM